MTNAIQISSFLLCLPFIAGFALNDIFSLWLDDDDVSVEHKSVKTVEIQYDPSQYFSCEVCEYLFFNFLQIIRIRPKLSLNQDLKVILEGKVHVVLMETMVIRGRRDNEVMVVEEVNKDRQGQRVSLF